MEGGRKHKLNMKPRKIFDLASSKNNLLQHGLLPVSESGILQLSQSPVQKAIYNISNYLLLQKVCRGDIIITITTGCKEWNWVDLAVMNIGAIHVTLSPTITVAQLNNILTETAPVLMFVQSGFVIPILESCSYYQSHHIPVVFLKPSENTAGLKLSSIVDENLSNHQIECIENLKAGIGDNDIALISYTSGTSDNLKGVQHSHRSVMDQVEVISEFYKFDEVKCAFSFLPVNYMYERLFNYIYQFVNIPIVYSDNNLSLLQNLVASKAGCCAMVPETLQLLLNTPWEVEALTSTLRFFFCGGAPLNSAIVDTYAALGIKIFEHYGSTETLIVSLNSHRFFRAGTPGKLIFPERCKTGSDGTLYYKSTFSGYFNNAGLNHRKIDPEGFYETGDIAEVDKDGFLTVKGRNSEMFKTNSGVFINPEDIEKKIALFCKASFIVVYRNNNLKPSAIIVPEPGIEDTVITNAVTTYNLSAKTDYVIEKIKIVRDQWSELTGELTGTRKIKRSFVIKKYGLDE
jgi:long-chain acyl-CoA synthetase